MNEIETDTKGADRELGKVEVVRVWDGLTVDTGELMMLRVFFPAFPPAGSRLPETSEELGAELHAGLAMNETLGAILESQLGHGLVMVRCQGIRLGSLEFWVSVTIAMGGIFKFFKDYESFRSGMLKFVSDVRGGLPKVYDAALSGYLKVVLPIEPKTTEKIAEPKKAIEKLRLSQSNL